MAKSGTVDVGSDIERARELCAAEDWATAYSCLSAIDPVLLSASDLELLAGSAYMLGRDDAYVDAWELAYQSHLTSGEIASAALCAWWIGDYQGLAASNETLVPFFVAASEPTDVFVRPVCETGARCGRR